MQTFSVSTVLAIYLVLPPRVTGSCWRDVTAREGEGAPSQATATRTGKSTAIFKGICDVQ